MVLKKTSSEWGAACIFGMGKNSGLAFKALSFGKLKLTFTQMAGPIL